MLGALLPGLRSQRFEPSHPQGLPRPAGHGTRTPHPPLPCLAPQPSRPSPPPPGPGAAASPGQHLGPARRGRHLGGARAPAAARGPLQLPRAGTPPPPAALHSSRAPGAGRVGARPPLALALLPAFSSPSRQRRPPPLAAEPRPPSSPLKIREGGEVGRGGEREKPQGRPPRPLPCLPAPPQRRPAPRSAGGGGGRCAIPPRR